MDEEHAFEFWEHFLLLMKIIDYVFAPVTTESTSYSLEIMIEDFLLEFRHLYPQHRITPKMHYLIHVPSWIRRLRCM